LGHSLIAIDAAQRGLSKLDADLDLIAADLDGRWEVLAEGDPNRDAPHGLGDAYERLKDLTRGRQIGRDVLREFQSAGLDIPKGERDRLLALEPKSYVGLAERLARDV